MSHLQQPATQSAIDVWQEYQDYLARFEASDVAARPLAFSEFQGALARWQSEYHPAWFNNDKAKMRELEKLLAL
jgi:hypothetical protein